MDAKKIIYNFKLRCNLSCNFRSQLNENIGVETSKKWYNIVIQWEKWHNESLLI